jgi:catechol 2,3-dioxygenase-like lactoylglutathione lyase family enzyme
MTYALDHVVILVHDLDRAREDYAALGFTVVPGGQHTDGATHNALIAFADGSYLELIAFLRAAPEHSWWRHAALGPGLIDAALLPQDIAADIAAARRRGLPLLGPFSGGRARPDGQRLAWETGRPTTGDLPFLCADVTPRDLRVPGGPAREHANGTVGVADITFAVAELEQSRARYEALLGSAPLGACPVRFRLGATTLTLAGPEDELARARLAERGEGPLALTLRAARSEALDHERSHGAQIRLAAEA